MKLDTIGDAFAWAFRDPAWPGKILLQGLITFIPIVGWIAMTGWLMLCFENARGGRSDLPPAGFHLGKGIGLFLVFLVYGVVLNIPTLVLYGLGGIVSNHSAGAGSAITLIGSLYGLAAYVLMRFLIPQLIVSTSRGGFAGGLDFQRVLRLSTANVNSTFIAALIIFVASVIGGFGVACCIGMIFTVPYENTVTAGAAAWFEKAQGAAAA